jgi:hypothetical protein
MRLLQDTTQHDTWLSGQYTGRNKPYARATVQRTNIHVGSAWTPRKPLDGSITTDNSFTASSNSNDAYASYYWGNLDAPRELPNIKSITWNRSIGQDAGTLTMVLYNTRALPLGVAPDPDDTAVDQAGFYDFHRGSGGNRWDHSPTAWTNRLYPDAMIKTYEGYGIDRDLPPDLDTHMTPSGVWFIDKIEINTDKTITVTARDSMRLLIDQICFPPIIPVGMYPVLFSHKHPVANPPIAHVSTAWVHPTYFHDSDVPYIGANGNEHGHHATDSFDGDLNTYWLSIGNGSPVSDYAFEYVEGTIPSSTVSAFRIAVKGGPYQVFVSVGDGTNWQGGAVIPYNPRDPVSAPNGSDVPYVLSTSVAADSTTVIPLPTFSGISHVRITFHDLWNSGIGPFRYRAALRDFQVATGVTTYTDGGTHIEGNYQDFSDIPEMFAAYAGFWWPDDTNDFYLDSDGGRHVYPPTPDPVLARGALWGDIEKSGTFAGAGAGPLDAGIDIPYDVFDKKPLMDGVSYIRDILGFICYCDETGGFIFRSPNIWSVGNNLILPGHRILTEGSRTADSVVIDENQTIISLTTTLDSSNVRERIVVANIGGSFGAVTAGFNPYNLPPTGFRRVGVWSDQYFTTEEECQKMADLIALRQLFTYYTDKITIPGNPEIQIDDQVTVIERVTEAADQHYVIGITSSLDNETGKWTYELDTHWLGISAFSNWAFDPANLSEETQLYLTELGKL